MKGKIMQFEQTDEKPTSTPLSDLEQGVYDALSQSYEARTVPVGGTLGVGTSFKAPVKDLDEYENVRKTIQKIAPKMNVGARVRLSGSEDTGLFIVFWAVELAEKLYVDCPTCGKTVAVTEDNKIRSHGPRDSRCEGSGLDVEVSESE